MRGSDQARRDHPTAARPVAIMARTFVDLETDPFVPLELLLFELVPVPEDEFFELDPVEGVEEVEVFETDVEWESVGSW